MQLETQIRILNALPKWIGVASLFVLAVVAGEHERSTDVAIFVTGLILLLNMPEPRK